MRIHCPHCDGKVYVSEAQDISPMMREYYCLCINHACGHAFFARTTVNRSVSPSQPVSKIKAHEKRAA